MINIRQTILYRSLVKVYRMVIPFKSITPKPNYTYSEFCESLSKSKGDFKKYNDFSYYKGAKFPFEIDKAIIKTKKTVFIRHDIDHSPFVSLEMAKIEASFGLLGSYYMLTTDNDDIKKIWKEDTVNALKALKEIQDLGHEVGLHYDLLGEYLETGNNSKKECEEILKTLRSVDIDVSGCVAHGSRRLAEYIRNETKEIENPRNCINFNIWEESNEKPGFVSLNNKVINIPFLKLADFGMRYEAYKVRRDYYHSDNGYVFWQHGDPINTINNVMKDGEVLCLLVHPFVWKDNLTTID